MCGSDSWMTIIGSSAFFPSAQFYADKTIAQHRRRLRVSSPSGKRTPRKCSGVEEAARPTFPQARRRFVARINSRAQSAPPQRHLREANVLRPAKLEHAVQRGGGN